MVALRASAGLRRVIKRVARYTALFLVSPVLIWFVGLAAILPDRRDQVLRGVSQLLSLLPGLLGSYLRVAFYSVAFPACGGAAHIGFGTIFATSDVSIGDRVYIGPFCNIGHADLGDDVLLGSNVTILSGNMQHRFDRTDVPINQQGGEYSRVSIGSDCWLGNGSIVMADIGPGSVVAAGAVVTKAVLAGDIVAGNPARVVKNRLSAEG